MIIKSDREFLFYKKGLNQLLLNIINSCKIELHDHSFRPGLALI